MTGVQTCALPIYLLERKVKADQEDDNSAKALHPKWLVFQWLSTGFLWSMWLVQDLANIFVYLPRELSWWGLALSLGGMALLQGYLFKEQRSEERRVGEERRHRWCGRS